MPTVEEIEQSMAPQSVIVDQTEKRLTPPRPPRYVPRIGPRELAGPSGQAALATGLAMTPIAGIPGFLAGATSSLLAEEGTRRLQEDYGPVAGGLIGTGLSAVTGGKIGVMGGIRPLRPVPQLAREQ